MGISEEWRMPVRLGLGKKEAPTHQTPRKRQWLREYEVARFRKVWLPTTESIPNMIPHLLIQQVFLKVLC